MTFEIITFTGAALVGAGILLFALVMALVILMFSEEE